MLKPLKWQEMVRRMKEAGFGGPRRGGKHPFMVKGELKVRIPNPHGGEISIGLISEILKQAGIDKKKW